MENKIIVLGVVLLLIIGAGYFLLSGPDKIAKPAACTLETKICPDGTSVARTEPDCNFAPCPPGSSAKPPAVPPQNTAAWETFTDPATGITFKYPKDLGTEYIQTVDWPPQTQIISESFSCTAGGTETNQAGATQEQIINNHRYCVTKRSEGAAGSIYTLYAYGLPKDGATLFFTFSLRFPQCANYPDRQKTACETEIADFKVDELVDSIAQSAL